jgi:flagellar basal-body rod protein FlgB
VAPESLFGNTMVMLETVLDFQSERHTILSTNVANVDTPGYKGALPMNLKGQSILKERFH